MGSFKLMCLIVFEIFSFHKCNKIHFRFSGAGAVCGEWCSPAPGPSPSPSPAPGAAAGQPQSSRQELSCEVHRPETTPQVPHKLSLAKYPSSISILADAIQSKVNMMTNWLGWLQGVLPRQRHSQVQWSNTDSQWGKWLQQKLNHVKHDVQFAIISNVKLGSMY